MDVSVLWKRLCVLWLVEGEGLFSREILLWPDISLYLSRFSIFLYILSIQELMMTIGISQSKDTPNVVSKIVIFNVDSLLVSSFFLTQADCCFLSMLLFSLSSFHKGSGA